MPSTERTITVRPSRSTRRRAPVKSRLRWTVARVEQLFALPFPDLMFRAQEVHRAHHAPTTVQLSRLISIKTGGCPEDCGYCPQAKRYHTGVADEALLDLDAVRRGRAARRRRTARRASAWARHGAGRRIAISSRCSRWCGR